MLDVHGGFSHRSLLPPHFMCPGTPPHALILWTWKRTAIMDATVGWVTEAQWSHITASLTHTLSM